MPRGVKRDPSERQEPAPRVRKRLTRAELTPMAREAIFAAASRVVGEVGYAEATVARITAAAGIAQGTFYLYFPTRQSLFDELLPHAGREMLALVRERAAGARGFFELEERGMAAFLEYVDRNPGFIRVLNEAEAAAPEAYRRHWDDIAKRYAREIREAAATGQLRALDEAEKHTAVYLMMGARVSLHELCRHSGVQPRPAVKDVVAHYMRMVRAWLGAPANAEALDCRLRGNDEHGVPPRRAASSSPRRRGSRASTQPELARID